MLEVQLAVSHLTVDVATPPDTEPAPSTALINAAQSVISVNALATKCQKLREEVRALQKKALHKLQTVTPAAVAQTTAVVEPMIDAPIPTHTTPIDAPIHIPTAIALTYESTYGSKFHNRPYCGRSGLMTEAVNVPNVFTPGDRSRCETCYGWRVVRGVTAI